MKIERGMQCKVVNTNRITDNCPEYFVGHFQEWITVNRDVWTIVVHNDGQARLHQMREVLFKF